MAHGEEEWGKGGVTGEHDVNKLSPASTWAPRELCLAYRSGHLLAEVTGMALFIYIDLMMRPCEADAQKEFAF